MRNGEVIEYRGNELRRRDLLAAAGKFAAISATGLIFGVDRLLSAAVPALAENNRLDDGETFQQGIAVAANPAALLALEIPLRVGSVVRTADGFGYEVLPAETPGLNFQTEGGAKLRPIVPRNAPFDMAALALDPALPANTMRERFLIAAAIADEIFVRKAARAYSWQGSPIELTGVTDSLTIRSNGATLDGRIYGVGVRKIHSYGVWWKNTSGAWLWALDFKYFDELVVMNGGLHSCGVYPRAVPGEDYDGSEDTVVNGRVIVENNAIGGTGFNSGESRMLQARQYTYLSFSRNYDAGDGPITGIKEVLKTSGYGRTTVVEGNKMRAFETVEEWWDSFGTRGPIYCRANELWAAAGGIWAFKPKGGSAPEPNEIGPYLVVAEGNTFHCEDVPTGGVYLLGHSNLAGVKKRLPQTLIWRDNIVSHAGTGSNAIIMGVRGFDTVIFEGGRFNEEGDYSTRKALEIVGCNSITIDGSVIRRGSISLATGSDTVGTAYGSNKSLAASNVHFRDARKDAAWNFFSQNDLRAVISGGSIEVASPTPSSVRAYRVVTGTLAHLSITDISWSARPDSNVDPGS